MFRDVAGSIGFVLRDECFALKACTKKPAVGPPALSLVDAARSLIDAATLED
jgi:hypothetical protein